MKLTHLHKENITLAGESAGAVFIHAHITIGNPIIKQCILLSGTLYLSPPQPRSVIDSLRGRVLGVLHQLDSTLTLENAPADKIVQAMTSLGHMSWFLEEEGERLGGWRDRTYTQRLLVSDVQNEASESHTISMPSIRFCQPLRTNSWSPGVSITLTYNHL